jgi:hypothetical protein
MTDCVHVWELRRGYSAMREATGIRRYRCATCGCWGWTYAQRRSRDGTTPTPRPVRAYDPPVTAPRSEWDEEVRYTAAVSASRPAARGYRGHGPDPTGWPERTGEDTRLPYAAPRRIREEKDR